jgi:hypothetical protein
MAVFQNDYPGTGITHSYSSNRPGAAKADNDNIGFKFLVFTNLF